jgi:hypothetical protein
MLFTEQQIKSIISLANIAGDKKDPLALQSIKVAVVENKLTALATNRYVIGQIAYGDVDEEDVSYLLSPEHLLFLKTAKGNVTVDVVETDLVITHSGNTHRSAFLVGNYPNVAELLTQFDNGENIPNNDPVRLDLGLLSKVSKIIGTNPKDKATFDFYTKGKSETNKPSPLVLKRDNITILFQPNLR